MSESGGIELKAVVPWLVASIMGVVAWFCRRDMGRYDEGLERIATLERNSVTYDHLDSVLSQMRNERALQHQEGQSALSRIEEKIDKNEERSSSSRHAIYNEIHVLALKIAGARQKRETD